ncbi:hypothetical protein CY35_07G011600 [Sphagnum magellanicum]|uniref:Uncharacterized protein n=1 Tax=Sphagnum magellanicum TaxID=128215 RepID=A0ACB8HJ03_9BRYO|nr:hypothetical protein CY35_07G011600 [Sphagnum magellanicum]
MATPQASVGLAWKWVLEKLVELPDFRPMFLKDIIAHVPDIEEAQCHSLLERVAIRYLEELVMTNQLDARAIPLLKLLIGQGSRDPSTGVAATMENRFSRELLLQVQTEAVLSILRRPSPMAKKDWAAYASALDHVFPEGQEEPHLIDRRKELALLLMAKNQTNEILARYLAKHPLNKLKTDLCAFVADRKSSFGSSFLNQLSKDVLVGNAPSFSGISVKEHVAAVVGAHEMREIVGTATNSSDGAESFGREENCNKEVQSLRMRRERNTCTEHEDSHQQVAKALGRSGRRRKLLDLEDQNEHEEDYNKEAQSLRMRHETNAGSTGQEESDQQQPGDSEKQQQKALGRSGRRMLRDSEDSTQPEEVTQLEKHQRVKKNKTISVDASADHHNVSPVERPKEAATQIVPKVSTGDDDQMDSLKNAASHDKPELHQAEDDGTHERGGRLGDESEMRECDTMEHIEIGSDDHEDLCHKCEEGGELLCCDGCPIAMHADCLEILGLKIPGPEDDWFCPICADKMAEELLADVKQAAADAKVAKEAFIREISKKRNHSQGDDPLQPKGLLHKLADNYVVKSKSPHVAISDDTGNRSPSQYRHEEVLHSKELRTEPVDGTLFPSTSKDAKAHRQKSRNWVRESSSGDDSENVAHRGGSNVGYVEKRVSLEKSLVSERTNIDKHGHLRGDHDADAGHPSTSKFEAVKRKNKEQVIRGGSLHTCNSKKLQNSTGGSALADGQQVRRSSLETRKSVSGNEGRPQVAPHVSGGDEGGTVSGANKEVEDNHDVDSEEEHGDGKASGRNLKPFFRNGTSHMRKDRDCFRVCCISKSSSLMVPKCLY